MTEPERIAQLFDRVVAEGAFAGPLPFGADVFVDASKYLRQQAATIEQLQQHLSRIETETKNWIDDLTAEGGARKVSPLEHILAVIQSRAEREP